MLGRNVSWLVCQLQTNELGLRHLFEELDGKTNSSTGWSGELGKMLKSVDSMEREYSFKVINKGPELIELPEDVLKDLSTDQNLLYQLAKAVRSGFLLDRLETNVTYLVSTYIPMWFQIKVKNSWLYGPRHVLNHL